MRFERVLARKRAAVSAADRREEKQLRERVQLAGREQPLDQVGSGQDWVRLSDEHIRMPRVVLSLADVDLIAAETGPDVRIVIVSGSASWSVTLADTSPAAAARFVQIAGEAKAIVHDVRVLYELRRSEALRDLSAALAERQAERDYCAARARELERELALDALAGPLEQTVLNA